MRRVTGRYSRRAFLGLVGAAGALAACSDESAAPSRSPTATATPAPTVVAPGLTGRIRVYSALDESTTVRIIDAFRSAHAGIEVDVLPLADALELQTRIRVERASPKGDLFLGGDSSLHDVVAADGLLERYVPPASSAIPDGAKDPKGSWTGWSVDVLSFAANAGRLSREIGGRQPDSWDDLLDAAWNAKLVLPDPAKTQAGYVFLALQLFRFDRDEDRAMDYMKALHAQKARYVARAQQVVELVARGDLAGGPSWAHDILVAKRQGTSIELAVPEPTTVEIGAVSIIKGAKDLPAAKAFVDWILGKEAGELTMRFGDRASVRRDVPAVPGAPRVDAVKLVSYDRPWANENRDRLLKKWQTAVRLIA